MTIKIKKLYIWKSWKC